MVSDPRFFSDDEDRVDSNTVRPARYLQRNVVYRFPNGHRYAGDQDITTMAPMWRDLLRLWVRLDYNYDQFVEDYIQHGIKELYLPYSSPKVRASNGWIYSRSGGLAGQIHSGLDWNDAPHSLFERDPAHTDRTHFEIRAAAAGTVVGWDTEKLLTLEHMASIGRPYRTIYNMLKDPTALVVDDTATPTLVTAGESVGEGALIGYADDPPPNVLHLHFGFALENTVPTGWAPDLSRLSNELSSVLGRAVTAAEISSITGRWSSSWELVEWFFFDPFGIYNLATNPEYAYGPGRFRRCFYYPAPEGIGTYAFRDPDIGGDPGGERIPHRAAVPELSNQLPVQPISMGTLVAL